MMIPIILVVACVLSTAIFIWTYYNWPQKRTLITKGLSSLLFITIAVSSFIIMETPANYAIWVIGALMFGMVGDLLLVYPEILKCFKLGLVCFLIGQILYSVAFIKFSGLMVYDILIYVAVVAICLLAYKKTSLKLGPMKMPVLIYLLIISFMFTMGISTIYKGGFNQPTTILIVAGATLFLASDAVLAFVRFQENANLCLGGINLVLYYSAQIILALSVFTFT